MATFNKFYQFTEHLAHGVHNLQSDTLKVYLSNSAPSYANTVYDVQVGVTGPAEISAGNGYTAGGITVTASSSAQNLGAYKLVLSDPALITASGGSIGPFRFVVLYNSTASNKLIGWWDYGTSIMLANTESFQVDFDQTNGIFTIN